jgi:transposase
MKQPQGAGKRRRFPREFKLEAVELAKSSGLTQRQIERELGLSVGQLGRWLQETEERGEEAFSEASEQTASVRIRELERRLAALEEEREILKKAVAIFSQAKP